MGGFHTGLRHSSSLRLYRARFNVRDSFQSWLDVIFVYTFVET